MPRSPRVAFLALLDSEFGRDIAHGVASYAERHGPWNILRDDMVDITRSAPHAACDTLADVDGVLAPFRDPKMAAPIRAAGRPTVAVASYDLAEGMPAVMTDEPKIGRMVAEHFLAKGLEHFAYFGNASQIRLVGRRDGFRRTVEAAGYAVSVYTRPHIAQSPANWRAQRKTLIPWLAGLPKPVGLMAVNDHMAQYVLLACHEAGLRIPEDVAIIGVDDDTPICSLCNPPLSSVEHGARQIGYQAAALLDKLMRGQAAPAEPILVPPVRIIERPSSDILAVGDPVVSAAVRFIRNHIADSIQVADVLEEVPVSRSTLEKAFRRSLKRTVHEEIVRVQIARAKQLLVNTDLSMPKIAAHCGFKYTSHLSASFKRRTGQTCTGYRRQFHLA